MWVEEGDGRRGVVEGLELLDAGLEAGDVLAHELGAGLALAVVVLAAVRLLGADALLACGFRAVAALSGCQWHVGDDGGRATDHLAFPAAEACLACGCGWCMREDATEGDRDVGMDRPLCRVVFGAGDREVEARFSAITKIGLV